MGVRGGQLFDAGKSAVQKDATSNAARLMGLC